MESLPKFGAPTAPGWGPSVEFTHPDIWQLEEYPEWARLTIGVREGEIPLILDLCRELPGPFGILYVLLASRCGREYR